MAHTNQTVNYHLSQFVGTDIPNPLVDYNGDMEKIDTAIKNVADASVGDRDDIAALQVQNGDEVLTTTAQTLSGAVNELDSDVGDLVTRVTTAEGKITADEGTLSTAVGNISTLSGKVSALETKVGSAVLTTVAADCSGAINELNGKLATDEANITSLQTQNGSEVLVTTAQTLSGAINELAQGGGGTVVASAVTYDNSTSGLVATNVQSAIDEIDATVDAIPVVHEEVQTATITSGSTSATLTFANEEIGATTLLMPFCGTIGVNAQITAYTTTTVTVEIASQASDVVVGVLAKN